MFCISFIFKFQGNAKAYSDINDPRLQWLENDFPMYLRKWKEVRQSTSFEQHRPKKMFLTQETEEGLLAACFSMNAIIKLL